MTETELREIYNKYIIIKTKAMHGIRITKKEALEALKYKKILNKYDFKRGK